MDAASTRVTQRHLWLLPALTLTVDLAECTVLVFDDHPVSLRILERQLAALGCQVIISITAKSCEDAWKELLLQGRRPNVNLIDHDLPDHPGPLLAQRIRANPAGSAVPIVMMTSLGTYQKTLCNSNTETLTLDSSPMFQLEQ